MKKICLMFLLISFGVGLAAQTGKEPYRAVLYSAVLPGGGQIYNHAYLKAGLVIGVQGFLVGSAIYNQDKRNEWRTLSQLTSDSFLAQQYMDKSDFYKERVNNNIWWIGITAGLSMIDAYVDALMYDYDSQKEKIRVRFENDALVLQYRF